MRRKKVKQIFMIFFGAHFFRASRDFARNRITVPQSCACRFLTRFVAYDRLLAELSSAGAAFGRFAHGFETAQRTQPPFSFGQELSGLAYLLQYLLATATRAVATGAGLQRAAALQ